MIYHITLSYDTVEEIYYKAGCLFFNLKRWPGLNLDLKAFFCTILYTSEDKKNEDSSL
ncbi:MAG: hypothetical protein ACI9P5_000990 [Saprospiraceae bacterium]|jgi:lipopolysaccharide biosynthesis glycosyltransferase